VTDESRPDVVVLEPGSESELPISSLAGHSANAPPDTVPLVILLEDLDSESAVGALRAGARAALPRDATPEQIRAAVHAAAAGLSSVPAALAAALTRAPAEDGRHPPLTARSRALTPREGEILTLLGEGLENKEIAVRLGISDHTVKTHLAAIYEKLDVANRAEAVATGLRNGLVML
jgi:DNA-binding NarL/FixJ family response regulator